MAYTEKAYTAEVAILAKAAIVLGLWLILGFGVFGLAEPFRVNFSRSRVLRVLTVSGVWHALVLVVWLVWGLLAWWWFFGGGGGGGDYE